MCCFSTACIGRTGRTDSVERHVVRMNESTKARLADALRLLPDVSPQTTAGAGSSAALEALQNNQADLGIVMADVAYRAYAGPTRGMSKRFDGLRGIAVLNINTIYLMANPLTGIQSIGDLRGHRIAIGSTGTATSAIAQLLLEASGLSLSQLKADVIPYAEALTLLTNGELDAAFLALNSSGASRCKQRRQIRRCSRTLDRAAAPELPVSSNHTRAGGDVRGPVQSAAHGWSGSFAHLPQRSRSATRLSDCEGVLRRVAETGAGNRPRTGTGHSYPLTRWRRTLLP